MATLGARSPPLGVLVEQVYWNCAGITIVRALVNWRRCCDVLVSHEAPADAAAKFHAELRGSQHKSAVALYEWWQGAYHERRFIRACQQRLFQSALRILQGEVDLVHTDIDEKENVYHYQMFWLWIREFMMYDDDINDHNLSALLQTRRISIKTAVCQRIAYSSFFSLISNVSWSPRSSDSGSTDSDFIDSGPPTLQGTVNLSPEVDHCQWLSPDEALAFPTSPVKELPFYLWDRELKKTVETRSLVEPPIYSIISHTWGRWKKSDPDVSVTGVPWPIPVNTRFDVSNLPNIMSAAVFQTRYVWLDLLCIPQSGAEQSLVKIRDAEVARQAKIFMAARRAYAWLLDVESWQGLANACHWISLNFLAISGANIPMVNTLLPLISEHAMEPTQLLHDWDYASRPAPHDLIPIGWFSSLWTLQEICIRPDMVLLNRDLVPFSLGNSCAAPILPFDSIVALANGYHNATCFRNRDAPDTVRVDLPPVFNTRFLYEAFKMELDPYLKNDADYVGESHRTYVRGVAHTWRWRKRMEMPSVGGPRGLLLEQVNKLLKRGKKKQNKHEAERDTVDFENEVDRPYMPGGSPIVPKGPSELICLLRLTRLDELLSLSRVDIIWAGNSRYCKRNRAVAIMSVVGATDWFQRQWPS